MLVASRKAGPAALLLATPAFPAPQLTGPKKGRNAGSIGNLIYLHCLHSFWVGNVSVGVVRAVAAVLSCGAGTG